VKKWKIFHANSNQKRPGYTTSDKIDFKTEIVTGGKVGHSKLIKSLIYQEDITMIKTYVPKNRAPK